MPNKLKLITALALSCSSAIHAYADAKLANIFSDHMVLQQQEPIVIWGTADANENITASIAGNEVSTIADAEGNWKIRLPALEGSYDAYTLNITANNTLTLEDILIGEVWLCTGQSNMEWPIHGFGGVDERDPDTDFPAIRMLDISRVSTPITPDEITVTPWTISNAENVMPFSATGYYFGRELHRNIDLPVGLVSVNWGGSCVQAWMSPESLNESQNAVKLYEQYLVMRENAERLANGEEALSDVPEHRENLAPCHLYHGMVENLFSLRFKGCIWYQGESNAGQPAKYRVLLPMMIADWRKKFDNPNMPFHQVQLAGYSHRSAAAWPALRQAQLEIALEDPLGGIATAIDLGSDNIHPVNKLDVGRRLARSVLVQDYGVENLAISGPIMKEACPAPNRHRYLVRFDTFGGELHSLDGEPIRGFEVAGADGVFHPAEVFELRDQHVVLISDNVQHPQHARYGWEALPDLNLAGADDLPALPFTSQNLFE